MGIPILSQLGIKTLLIVRWPSPNMILTAVLPFLRSLNLELYDFVVPSVGFRFFLVSAPTKLHMPQSSGRKVYGMTWNLPCDNHLPCHIPTPIFGPHHKWWRPNCPPFLSSCRALGQEKSISLGKPMPWFRKIETKSLATYKSSKFMDLPCFFQKYPKFMISFGKKSCYLRRSRILRIRDHRSLAPGVFKVSQIKVRSWSQINQVPGLVNIQKTMENHNF